MPFDIANFHYFLYVLYVPVVFGCAYILGARTLILAIFTYKLILSFITMGYVGMFPFYSGDSSHFIEMVDYLVDLHGDGDYKLFSIIDMNSAGLTGGLANGTSYAFWGALFTVSLGFDAPVSLLLVSQFSSVIIGFNIYFISKSFNLDAKIPLLIYFLMPLSVMYSSYILKDAYVSAVFTSLFYVLFVMHSRIFRLLAVLILSSLLLLDRWYILVFFVGAYLFSKTKINLSLWNASALVIFLVFVTFLLDLFGYPLSLIVGGYGSNQAGFFGGLPLLFKIVLMPLMIWKTVLSPNFAALLNNQSLPSSEIYSIFHIPQLVFATMFGVLLLFWLRNFRFILGSCISNYFQRYPDIMVIHRFTFFFLFTLSLYSTSHGRVREAIIPILIVIVSHFFVKGRKKFI